MRIAVTCALPWPYIRRGNRLPYELAVALGARGHEVTFITASPGRVPRVVHRDGIIVEYHPLFESPLLTLVKVQKMVTFARPCLRSLLERDFDIVQTSHPIDSWAASRCRARKGTPFVYMLLDCLPPYPRLFLHETMFRRGAAAASGIVMISDFVNQAVREETGFEGIVIPPGVDLEQFPLGGPKTPGAPRILCTASPLLPRKRVGLLVRGFEKLLPLVPDAVLQLSGHSSPATDAELLGAVGPAARRSIEILGVGPQGELPALYRKAAISVLPSLNEGFGLVLVESLASGTPAAGTRSGAIPEVLDDSRVGALIAPEGGADEVASALAAALRLGQDPATPARCREHVASRYAWPLIAARYEEVYEKILARERRPARAATGMRAPAAAPPPGPVPLSTPERAFDDALDAMNLPLESYYDIDCQRPRLVRLLKCVSSGTGRFGPALVRGPFAELLAAALQSMGFAASTFREEDARVPREGGDRGSEGGLALYVWDDLPPETPDAIIASLPTALAPGGTLVVAARVRSARTLELTLARTDLTLELCRRIRGTRSVRRDWASTPVKIAVKSSSKAVATRLIPGCRSHVLVVARRRS